MDDISAIAESKQELTKILRVIGDFISKWQLGRKGENVKINIGNKVLESKNSILKKKCLGEIITPNLKVATHLQAKEIQINGIIQSYVFASSNEVLPQIKMETF